MARIVIDRVLLASDFSPGSVAALPYAVALARRFVSKLYLAYVIPAGDYGSLPRNEQAAALEKMRARAQEQMSGLRAMPLLKGVAQEVLIGHGEVWPALEALLDENRIDLLVISTHGRRGVEKLVLGSTAEEILRLAQIPVLMVGPGSSLSPEAEASLERILHATDFSPESEAALHYAFWLAGKYRSSLTLLHVADNVWNEPFSTKMQPADFFRLRFLEAHWRMETEAVQPEFQVEFGPRAESILRVADQLRSEMIILGVRGARHPRIEAHLPRPTAYDVVSRARCPVLVVRGATVET
jgi:nucleotide-binding universal stress UspA family protein